MNEAAFKSIIHKIKGAPDNGEQSREVESSLRPTAAEETSPAETLAAQVLAEYQPSEARLIVRAWNDILGVKLNPDRVGAHLEELRKWERSWHRG